MNQAAQSTTKKNPSMMTKIIKKNTVEPILGLEQGLANQVCVPDRPLRAKYTDGGDFFFHVSAQQASDKARGNHSNYEYSSSKNSIIRSILPSINFSRNNSIYDIN